MIGPMGTCDLDAKYCPKCGESKPRSLFHRNRLKSDGLEYLCKDCTNRRIREAYAKDPAKKIARTRLYHLDNPEWSKAVLRAWHLRNADRRNEYVKRRRVDDPEFLEYRREQSRRSEIRRRAIKAGVEADVITTAEYQRMLEDSNNRCWICDWDLSQETVHWDHVQPLARGGVHTPKNLKPACAPCNTRKNARWPMTEKLLTEIKTQSLLSRTPVGGVALCPSTSRLLVCAPLDLT